MTTANIVMAVCLIILMGMAVLLIVRYMRKTTELQQKERELNVRESNVQKRENALDRWSAEVKAQAKQQAAWSDKRKHIYANLEVLDSEDKPADKAIGKSLSSKIGYALRKQFPEINVRHDANKGGRTVYSVDCYVMPYEESV